MAAAYTFDSQWRNRSEFVTGRDQIIDFLARKWQREQGYALRKSLWAFSEDRIAVRFQYEWHDEAGQSWRSYGNENWQFDPLGFMSTREASINDVAIEASERRIFGARPDAERDQALPLCLAPVLPTRGAELERALTTTRASLDPVTFTNLEL